MATSSPGTLALDTSVVVALVCAWHDRHAETAHSLSAASTAGVRFLVPAPVLVEAYAVLTRLPPPHRLAPADALHLLEANFRGGASCVALSVGQTWAALQALPAAGVAGGRTYDALIAACARKGGATALLTWNPTDFEPHAGPGLAIRTPAIP